MSVNPPQPLGASPSSVPAHVGNNGQAPLPKPVPLQNPETDLSSVPIIDRLKEAESVLFTEHFAKSSKIYEEILKIHPDHIQARAGLVIAKIRTKQAADVMKMISDMRARHSKSALPLACRAFYFLNQKTPGSALDDANEALNIDKGCLPALQYRVIALQLMRKSQEVVAAFREAVECEGFEPAHFLNIMDCVLPSDAVSSLALKAFIYFEEQKDDQALENANEALEKEPDLSLALAVRGAVKVMEKTEGGQNDLEQAIENSPNFVFALSYLATWHYKQQQYAEARDRLNQALKLDKRDEVSLQVQRWLDQEAEISNDQDAGTSNSEDLSALYDGVIESYQKGELQKCVKAFREVRGSEGFELKDFLTRLEGLPDAASLKGFAYFEEKDYANAVKSIDAISADQPLAQAIAGMILFEQGHHQEAQENFQKTLEHSPDFTLALSYSGASYLREGEYQKALEKTNRALELDPFDAFSFLTRSQIKRAMGDYEPALNDLHGESVVIYANRAEIFCLQERFEEAKQEALKSNEIHPLALSAQSAISLNEGCIEEALFHADRAIGSSIECSLVDAIQGKMLLVIGKKERAISCFIRAVEKNPYDAHSCLELGAIYAAEGNIERAIELLQAAQQSPLFDVKKGLEIVNTILEHDEKLLVARSIRSCLYLMNGQKDKAYQEEKWVGDYALSTTGLHGVNIVRADRLRSEKKYGDAVLALQQVIQHNPKHRFAYEQYQSLCEEWGQKNNSTRKLSIKLEPSWPLSLQVDACIAAGCAEKALELVESRMQEEPKNAQFRVLKGMVCCVSGDFDAAIKSCDTALQLDPENHWALSHRGHSYLQRGDINKAKADFESALKRMPHSLFTFAGLAECLKGGPEDSLNKLHMLFKLSMDRDRALARVHRAKIYQEVAALDLAERDLDDALELLSRQPEIFLERAVVRAKKKNRAGCLEDIKSAQQCPAFEMEFFLNVLSSMIEIDSEHHAIQVLQGKCCFDLGRYEQAIEALSRVPETAEVYQCRGQAYAQLGELEKASFDFNHVLEQKPEDLHTLFELAKIYRDQGKEELAKQMLKKALDQDPDNPGILKYCAQAFVSKKQPIPVAVVEAPPPVSIEELLEEAEVYLRAGQMKEAMDIYHGAEFDDAELSALNLAGLALFCLKRRDYRQASRHLAVSLQKDPTCLLAIECHVLLQLCEGKSHAAVLKLKEARKHQDFTRERFLKVVGAGLSLKESFYCALEGLVCFEEGDYGDAEFCGNEALKEDPELTLALALRGALRFERGENALAKEDLEKVVEHDSDFVWALSYLAAAHLKSGEYEEGLAQLVGRDLSDPFSLLIRSQINRELQNYDQALQDLQGEDAAVVANRAEIYRLQGRSEEAKELLQSDSTHPLAQITLSAIALSEGRMQDALFRANAAVNERGLEQTLARTNRANIYLQQGNLDAAEKELDVALELTPHDPKILLQRAIVRAKKGNASSCLADVNMAIQLAVSTEVLLNALNQILDAVKDNDALRFLQGKSHFDLGNYSEAIAIFGKIAESVELLKYRGHAYAKTGAAEKAISDFTKVLAQEPKNVQILFELAKIYRDQKENEKGMELLRQASQLAPEDAEILKYCTQAFLEHKPAPVVTDPPPLSTAEEYMRNGKWQKAVIAYGQILQVEPSNVQALVGRGLAHQKLGNDELASTDLGKAYVDDPKSAFVLASLAVFYLRKQSVDQALVYAKKALTRDSQNLLAMKCRAILLQIKGKNHKAVMELRKARDCEEFNREGFIASLDDEAVQYPAYVSAFKGLIHFGEDDEKTLSYVNAALEQDSNLTLALALKGAVSFETNQSVEAEQSLKKIVEENPDFVFALSYLAASYLRSGEYENGLQVVNHALEVDPADSFSLFVRGQINRAIGNYEAALQDLQGEGMVISAHRAEIYRLQGHLEEAEEERKKALGHPLAAVTMSAMCFPKKQMEEALFYVDQAIGSPIDQGIVAYVKGKEAVSQEIALRYFTEAVNSNPCEPSFRLARGKVYAQTGDYDKALEDLQAAREHSAFSIEQGLAIVNHILGEDSEHELARSIRAYLHFAKEDKEQAYADSKDLDLDDAVVVQAAKFGEEGKWIEAFASLRTVLGRHPTHQFAIQVYQSLSSEHKPKKPIAYEEDIRSQNIELLPSWPLALKVHACIAEGRIEQALELIHAKLEDDAGNIHLKVLQGIVYRVKGDFVESVRCLSAVLEEDSENVWARANRGESYRQQGEVTKALSDFEFVLQRAPDHVLASTGLGLVEETFNNTYRLLKLTAGHTLGHVLRAKIYLELDAFEFAEQDINTAIEIARNDPKLFLERAVIRSKQGDQAKTLADVNIALEHGVADTQFLSDMLEKMLHFDPSHSEARFLYGKCVFELGDNDQAIQAFNLVPETLEVWKYRGQAYARAGKGKEAIADFKKILEKSPNNVLFILELAKVYLNQGKSRKALIKLKQALKTEPDNSDVLAYCSQAYFDEGKIRRAHKVAKQATELDNTSLVAWKVQGNVHCLHGRHADAQKCFENGLETHPNNLLLLESLGAVDRWLGEYELAKEMFDQIIVESEKKELHLEQIRRADEAFKKLSLSVPDYSNTARDLARANYRDASSILKNTSQEAEVAALQSVVYCYQGLQNKALDLLNASDDQEHPMIQSALGAICFERREIEDALKWLNSACALDPNLPLALQNRAKVLEYLGRDKEALQDCERALEIYHEDVISLALMAKIYCKQGWVELATVTADRGIQVQENMEERDKYGPLWAAKGETCRLQGKFETACQHFTFAQAHSPSHLPDTFAIVGTAKIDLLKGEYDAVIEKLSRIIHPKAQAFPKAVDQALSAYTQANEEKKPTPEVKDKYRKIVACFDLIIDFLSEELKKDVERARENVERVLEEPFAVMQHVDQLQTKCKAIVKELDAIVDLSPDAQALRGEVYRLQGKHEEAIADFDAAIKKVPSGFMYAHRGAAYALRVEEKYSKREDTTGDSEQSKKDLQKALELNPDDPFASAQQERLLAFNQKTEVVGFLQGESKLRVEIEILILQKKYKDALKKQGDTGDPLQRAWLYLLQHDYDKAKTALGAFQEKENGERFNNDKRLFLIKAVLCIGEEKYNDGLEYVNRVLSDEPDHVLALETRGKIYLKQDKKKKAFRDLSKAFEIDPTSRVLAREFD